eukprot:SAG22_NODE_315_length_12535_cov_3.240351_13_plen_185_part_00
MPDEDIAEDFEDGGQMTGSDIRAELARLRADLDSGKAGGGGGGGGGEFTSFDPAQPAVLPTNVPALPMDYEETSAVKELRALLLQPKTDPKYKTRVGFFGMGGMGKTVTGVALARCGQIRAAFDQIIWLPLGQAPVMEKLQRLCVMQLTGKRLPQDFGTLPEEDKYEMLRGHFAGRNVMLCLDE